MNIKNKSMPVEQIKVLLNSDSVKTIQVYIDILNGFFDVKKSQLNEMLYSQDNMYNRYDVSLCRGNLMIQKTTI